MAEYVSYQWDRKGFLVIVISGTFLRGVVNILTCALDHLETMRMLGENADYSENDDDVMISIIIVDDDEDDDDDRHHLGGDGCWFAFSGVVQTGWSLSLPPTVLHSC